MSEKTAKALVTISAAAIGIYGLVLHPAPFVHTGQPGFNRYRYLGAVALVFVFLSLLADISPEVAGPLALLLALAVYANYAKQQRSGSVNPAVNPRAAGPVAPTGG